MLASSRLIYPATLVVLTAWHAGSTAEETQVLNGCWRSQQVQLRFASHGPSEVNGDCVSEYDGGRARSRCHYADGDIDILSAYEQIGPGRMQITQRDSATGKPVGDPAELGFRVDGDWLLTTRQYTPAAPASGPGERPQSMAAVSIRVDTSVDKEACRPRGKSSLRIGRTPVSSLAMSVPDGWQPFLVDLASNKELASAVNTSFLIGAFVPRGTDSTKTPAKFVLVVDDVHYGRAPVRAAEFAEVKGRFASELGSARVTCNMPDRICGILHLPDEGLVYTELLNVSGRVAMITATVPRAQRDSAAVLRDAVRTFSERLRQDNAK